MFKNPVLEYFSHIHPITPVVVFVPVVVVCCWVGFSSLSLVPGLAAFFGGALLWTFMEYAIHRWAFHYEPKSDFGKYVHFLVHGVHHDYPRDSTRLVMPLLVSVPLAAAFFLLFGVVFGEYQYIVFAGFIAGYVAYDSMHYAVHHFPMKNRVAKFMKHYHLRHHYNDDNTAYGISSPLWDVVFRTMPEYLRSDSDKDEQDGQEQHDGKDTTKGKRPVVENSL